MKLAFPFLFFFYFLSRDFELSKCIKCSVYPEKSFVTLHIELPREPQFFLVSINDALLCIKGLFHMIHTCFGLFRNTHLAEFRRNHWARKDRRTYAFMIIMIFFPFPASTFLAKKSLLLSKIGGEDLLYNPTLQVMTMMILM